MFGARGKQTGRAQFGAIDKQPRGQAQRREGEAHPVDRMGRR